MTASQPTFELSQYLAPLRRYRAHVITFVVAATLSSVVMTYAVSERYRATSTVLYQPNESVSFRPKVRDAFGFPMPLVPLESIGNTIDEVAHSDALLTETVRALHLDQKAPYTGNAFVRAFKATKDYVKELRGDAFQVLKYGRVLPKDPFADAVAGLKEDLKVKPSTKAYTFDLEVTDTNPNRAAATVDMVAQLLSQLLARADAEAARAAAERLAPQLNESTNAVAALHARIDAFKARSNISSLDDELTLRLKSVSGFQDELASVEHDLRSSEDKQRELSDQIANQPANVRYSATMTQNPVVDQLRKEITDLAVERAGLLEKFTTKHPQVQAIDAKIADAKDALSREDQKQLSSESTGINEVRQKLVSEKLETEAQIAALRAKRAGLRGTIDTEIEHARSLTKKESEQGQLTLQLSAAEKNYALVSEAYEEARVAEAKASSEVLMLSSALVPRAPVMPLKILHISVSFLLSLMLSVGGVYLFDYLDPKIQYGYQLERALDAPLMMSLPDFAVTGALLEDFFPAAQKQVGG
jgi:polysaccharide biosynthesis transport protein